MLCAAGCASKQEPVALVIPATSIRGIQPLITRNTERPLQRLAKGSRPDQRLALLYKASVDHTELFETGGWQVDLNRALAAEGGKEWIPARRMKAHSRRQPSGAIQNKKLIALYDDSGSIRLAGNLYVRLPETMRAQNKKEADGVLILRRY